MPMVVKLEENDAEPVYKSSEGESKCAKNLVPKDLTILTNDDEDMRVNVLVERYGHIKRSAHILKPGDVTLHMKIDAQTINQGKCFYNPVQDTYFVRAKRNVNARKQKDDRIFMEIEKYEETANYKSITFFITGKHISDEAVSRQDFRSGWKHQNEKDYTMPSTPNGTWSQHIHENISARPKY